jgi:hypothetical protein
MDHLRYVHILHSRSEARNEPIEIRVSLDTGTVWKVIASHFAVIHESSKLTVRILLEM